MGLDKKTTKRKPESRYHSDYEKSLIAQYNQTLADGQIATKPQRRGLTLAQKIAICESGKNLETLLKIQNKLDEKQSRLAYRHFSSHEVIEEAPNYFLTLSMDACFDRNWHRYDRDHKTRKLYRSVLVLIKKLFIQFDPSLRDKPYEKWPFFLAVMEHFDREGNLVAPHIHLVLKIDVGLAELMTAIKEHWRKAVPEAGVNGIDLQYLDSYGLPDRAHYLFKDAYQDDEFKLDNGAMPDLIRQRYGWSKDSVSHDMWLIRRENFRAVLARKSVAFL